MMEYILQRNAKEALLLLGEMYAGGKDVGAVLGELSTLTRDLLLRRTAPEGSAGLMSGGFDSTVLDRLGKAASGSRLLYLATTLQKTTAELYASSNRRTDAELCILKLCDESLSGDLTALESRIQRLEEALARGQVIRTAVEQSVGKAAPVSKKPPQAEEIPPWEAPAAKSVQQHVEEKPPLPEEPPMMEEPGERVYDIPEEIAPVRESAAPVKPAAVAPKVGSDWWSALAEACKGRLSPMYRVFLDMCSGTLEGDLLTVYAPDDMTLGRLNNDRVKGALQEEAQRAAGIPVRLVLRVGAAPKANPEENFKNLLKFSSQFDNIEIK
jgi:DNA polymerase-3 subunit gamma/tau